MVMFGSVVMVGGAGWKRSLVFSRLTISPNCLASHRHKGIGLETQGQILVICKFTPAEDLVLEMSVGGAPEEASKRCRRWWLICITSGSTRTSSTGCTWRQLGWRILADYK